MRSLALALVLLATAARAEEEEEWAFSFGNGDRVRGAFSGMRNGSVLVGVPATPSAVAVPFAEIAKAEPLPADPEAPPRRAAQLLRLRDGGALLGRCRAIRQGKLEFEVESLGRITIPGRDVEELLPAEDAVRAYHRSMTDPSDPLAALPPERFDALWAYLGRPDGNVAWQAHRDLVRAAGAAVPLLDARLRIQPDAPAMVDAWIRSLDADSADVRLLAHGRLRALGAAAAPRLRVAARGAVSAEARQRLAALLAALAAADPGSPAEPDPEVVRFLRAIRILEEIGTPDAQSILERLAKAAPEAPTGREAQAALERLRRVR